MESTADHKRSIQIAKKTVKDWEKEYIAEFNKKPSRDSIKQAPAAVWHAYKLYWKYSRSLGSSSKFNEDSKSPASSQTGLFTTDDENSRECFSKVEPEAKSVVETWGLHLNKSNAVVSEVVETNIETSLYAKMAERMRNNGKVKTRKSLKRFTRQTIPSELKTTDCSLDLESTKENNPKVLEVSISPEPPSEDLTISCDTFSLKRPFQIFNSKKTEESHSVNASTALQSSKPLKFTSKSWNKDWVNRCSQSVDEFPIEPIQSNSLKRKALELTEPSTSAPKKMKTSQEDSGYSSPTRLSSGSISIAPLKSPPDFDDDEDEIISSPVKSMPKTLPLRYHKVKVRKPEIKEIELPPEIAAIAPDEDSQEPYNELIEMEKSQPGPVKRGRKALTAAERLQSKMDTGQANQNFVKINLKKKVFVRGKKRMSAKNYKIQEWKKKQASGDSAKGKSSFTCFKCGEFGHWAANCTGKSGENLLPLDDMEEPSYLSLEEASQLAKGLSQNSQDNVVKVDLQPPSTYDPEEDMFADIEEDQLISETPTESPPETPDSPPSAIPPIYPCENGEVQETPKEVIDLLNKFGYRGFRTGQEKAIMRVLSGLSTLLVLSTGSGKSLCYQLPAFLYAKKHKCITLCISPLVSLMEDQVTGLPHFLKAVCLHTQQNPANREKAMKAIKNGSAHILLLSPEAIVSSHAGGVLGRLLQELPPVAFACLDEAHCLSQWSHNFRPSYLQVCKVLKEKFNVHTILGLTATAKVDTAKSIAEHIKVADLDRGIITGTSIPKNLNLSASRDANREEALLILLNGKRFSNLSSIIVYCTRREQCEKVAILIRSQLFNSSKANGKRGRGVSVDAEAYHAGLSAYRRNQIQKNFMSGKLRIVVATVAFGMGIDKADVEGIIHFNMPRNLESYVQEIGRAGRNGEEAHCHLFLDTKPGNDVQELKRHIYSNSVDRFSLRKLLDKLFITCKCAHSQCMKHEVGIPISPLIEELDIPEENIQTLLCYLELHPKGCIELKHHAYCTCRIACYRGPSQLSTVSRKCPPLAAAIAVQMEEGAKFQTKSSIAFPVVEISSRMQWRSNIVKQELKKLEWDNSGLSSGGPVRKSGVKVEFSDIGFHVMCRGDLTDEEQDEMLDFLYQRTTQQEKHQLRQLVCTYKVLESISHPSVLICAEEVEPDRVRSLRDQIDLYFLKGVTMDTFDMEEQFYIRPDVENRLRSDIRALCTTHCDQVWNGRAVARVFHGIGSPNYPATMWCKVRRFWRCHLSVDFNRIVCIAKKEILKMR